jgi:hypothetical protein
MPELLETARQWLDINLKPGGYESVAKALTPLLATTLMPNTEGMEPETLQKFGASKMAEYGRHLIDIPADILEAACDECARTSQFFPALAEIYKHARPMLEKRRRQAERVAILISDAKKPATKPAPEPFKPEPKEVRLRTLRDGCRRNGHIDRAAKYERELAVIEKREPEEWATLEAPKAEVGIPTSGKTMAEAREWKRAPDAWQAGAPLYQQRQEEPPPPSDSDAQRFSEELEP